MSKTNAELTAEVAALRATRPDKETAALQSIVNSLGTLVSNNWAGPSDKDLEAMGRVLAGAAARHKVFPPS